MDIVLNNKTLDGKYQKLLFAFFDLMDKFNNPITIVLGENNTIKNFKLDPMNYKIGSNKFEFSRIVWEAINQLNK